MYKYCTLQVTTDNMYSGTASSNIPKFGGGKGGGWVKPMPIFLLYTNVEEYNTVRPVSYDT